MNEFSKLNLNGNEYIVKDLKARNDLILKSNKIKPSYINSDYIYTVANNIEEGPYLYVSKNGIDFDKVCSIPEEAFKDIKSESTTKPYDYSLIIDNGYLYITYDFVDSNYNDFNSLNKNYFIAGNRIGVSRTKDFINWESWNVEINSKYKQTWAPEFFIDSKTSKKYISVSLGNGINTYEDVKGETGYLKEVYLLEMDEDFKTIISTNKLMTTNTCYIDSFIYSDNDKYYLIVKDEVNKSCKIYESDNLLTFTNNISTVEYYDKTGIIKGFEGYSIIKKDNLFFLYADCYEYNHKTILFISSDLVNWSIPSFLTTPTQMIHFTVKTTNETDRIVLDEIFKNTNYPSLTIDKIYPQNRISLHRNHISNVFYPLPEGSYEFYGTEDITLDPINYFFANESDKNYKYTVLNESGNNLPIKIIANNIVNEIKGSSGVDLTFIYNNTVSSILNNSERTKTGVIELPTYTANTDYTQIISFNNEFKINGVIVTPVVDITTLKSCNLKYSVDSIGWNDFRLNVCCHKDLKNIKFNYIVF